MAPVAKLEQAIAQLTPAEFTELAHWITAGRLDFLLEEIPCKDRP